MLVARAFVLGVNARAALAVGIVALSVAYAILTGAAAHGLHDASATLGADLLAPRPILALPGLSPFEAASAPEGSTLLAHAPWEGMVLGTVRPWPYGAEAVPGPYARPHAPAFAARGLVVGAVQAHDVAPWDWVLVSPAAFDALAPGLLGKATMALAPAGAPAPPGLTASLAPGAGLFYRAGADQIFDSVQLVILAVGAVVALLAGGVLRLEVLARARDLATLEALGGRALTRRVVVLRALVLVAAGVGLGAVGGVVGARLAGRALGVLGLRAGGSLVAEVVLVAFIAGFLAASAGGLAGLRAPLAARLGRRGPATRPFPGPIRFLIVTPRVFASAFAASLILTAVGSVVLAAASVPFALFHTADGTQVLGQASGNPFRGSADRAFGERAALFEGIQAASPETLAPTLLRGEPVMLRGVSLDAWRALTPARLEAGRWTSAPGEAMVGARAATLLGLGPGDAVMVPGGYRPTLRELRVVGVLAGAGLYDDEILTDLDTAGDLAALPPHVVHLIRIQAAPGAVDRALLSNPIVATNLTIQPAQPVPFTLAVVQVGVANAGGREASRVLALTVNNVTLTSTLVRLPPRGEGMVEIPFTVPDAPVLDVRVNPEAQVATGQATLHIVAPATLAANATFQARVLDAQRAPVAGAFVAAGGQERVTDAGGNATMQAGAPGTLLLNARWGNLQGGAVVYVVDPAWALTARVQGDHALVEDARFVNATEVRYTLAVTVTNLGGATFDGTVNATLGDRVLAQAAVALEPRARATVQMEVVVPHRTDRIEVAGLAMELPDLADPTLPPEQRPMTVAEVLAAKRALLERSRSARELTGQAFLEDVFRHLEPSVVLVVLATFLHAGAAVGVAVVREVRERGPVVEVLRQLGATPDQVGMRAARDALLAATPGLVLGTAAALAALLVLQPRSFPAAFGHTLPVTLDPSFYARVVGGLLVVAVLAAVVAARAPPEAPLAQVARRPLADITGESP